jgi:hypothetical protein
MDLFSLKEEKLLNIELGIISIKRNTNTKLNNNLERTQKVQIKKKKIKIYA